MAIHREDGRDLTRSDSGVFLCIARSEGRSGSCSVVVPGETFPLEFRPGWTGIRNGPMHNGTDEREPAAVSPSSRGDARGGRQRDRRGGRDAVRPVHRPPGSGSPDPDSPAPFLPVKNSGAVQAQQPHQRGSDRPSANGPTRLGSLQPSPRARGDARRGGRATSSCDGHGTAILVVHRLPDPLQDSAPFLRSSL
jgi:hypothetical protein